MNRCPGCLEDKGNTAVCPVCRWDERSVSFSLFLPPGTVLNGKYWLGRTLGHGGFGITYLAWDMELECKVAIKEHLPIHVANREDGRIQVSRAEVFQHSLRRFREEAQALARFLEEPGIMPVLTFFVERDTGYFVMPYFTGCTLKEFLEQRGTALPLHEAFNLLQPVFVGLAKVHTNKMIHRDISPDNIYITADNNKVMLFDFGAARYVVGTDTHTIIVKPGFAPPEQYQSNGKQGAWTDVYALAATLYWMITGQIPPEAMERHTAMRNGKSDPLQSPVQYGVVLPKRAEATLLKALHTQWQNRYQDVAAFQWELSTTLPKPDDHETPSPPPTWREYLFSPLLVGVYIAIGVTSLLYLRLGWFNPVPSAAFWSLMGGVLAGAIGWRVNRKSNRGPKEEDERQQEEVGHEQPVVPPKVGGWVLICTHGELVGCGFPITTEGLIIGRDSQQANVILSNPQVGRCHARLRLSGEGIHQAVVLEDLGSTNGTYVLVSSNPSHHWEPLPPRKPLTLGLGTTTFSVGNTSTVRFQIAERDAEKSVPF